MRDSATKGGRKTTFKLNRAVLTAAGAAGLLPLSAEAAADNWSADSGNWNSAINWANGIPIGSMDVNIVENDSTDRTVTYDYIGNAIILNSLLVDNTGGGTNTFSLPENVLTSNAVYAGSNGVGVINQSGGTNNTKNLYLGYGSLASGVYSLSGGSLTASVSSIIGAGGVGAFNQNGGTHVVGVFGAPGKLYVGYNNGSGTYTLSAGNLRCIGTEYIGFNAQGVFNQSGGYNSGTLMLGYGANSAIGTYNLNKVGSFGGNIFVGYGGTGIFSQTGTTVYGGQIQIGYSNGAGDYTLTDGVINSGSIYQLGFGSAGFECVGSGGVGVFNQNSGTNTINASNAAALCIGFNGGTGTYNLRNGSLDILGNVYRVITAGFNTIQIGVEYVGSNGAGVFNQTGGTHNVSGSNGAILSIGYSNGTGRYDLGSGLLSVWSFGGTSRLSIGENHGTGLFLRDA